MSTSPAAIKRSHQGAAREGYWYWCRERSAMACGCTSSGQCHKCSRSCGNPAQKGVFPSPSFSCCSCNIIFGRHWQSAPTPSKSTVCKVSCWMPMSLTKRNFVPPEVEVNVWDMPSFFLMRRSCSRKVSANVY